VSDEAYPHPDRLLDEINGLLDEGLDSDTTIVSLGVLRRSCWHLLEFKRLSVEIEQLKKVAAASEKLRYLMHIKGFEGTEECGAHMDLLDAMHDAGLPCAAKGRDRETTKHSVEMDDKPKGTLHKALRDSVEVVTDKDTTNEQENDER